MAEAAESYNVPRGAAYLTSEQVVSHIAYFLFYIILARWLSKDDIGLVSLLAAVLTAFNTLTQMALPATATRYISNIVERGRAKLRRGDTTSVPWVISAARADVGRRMPLARALLRKPHVSRIQFV